MAFITETDYDTLIKPEIKNLLDTSADQHALKRAEDTAIQQIRNHLGGRFDLLLILIEPSTPDLRDQFIVTIAIDITLYHLYAKTGHRDIPQHRQDRYGDALKWLSDAGTGKLPTDLPLIETGSLTNEARIWSKAPSNHKW